MLGAKVTGPSSLCCCLYFLVKNKTSVLLGFLATLIRMHDTHMCTHTHCLSLHPSSLSPSLHPSLYPSSPLSISSFTSPFSSPSILPSLYPFSFSVAVTLTPPHFLQFSACSLLCLDYPGATLRFPDVFPSVMEWSMWLTQLPSGWAFILPCLIASGSPGLSEHSP